MDELAWSLFGVNYHYGTPRNPNASNKIPGGSSSEAPPRSPTAWLTLMGTDTEGPCACLRPLWAVRDPTHARQGLARGARSLAPSFDTCGIRARRRCSGGWIQQPLPPPATRATTPLTRWLVAADAFDRQTPRPARRSTARLPRKGKSSPWSSSPPHRRFLWTTSAAGRTTRVRAFRFCSPGRSGRSWALGRGEPPGARPRDQGEVRVREDRAGFRGGGEGRDPGEHPREARRGLGARRILDAADDAGSPAHQQREPGGRTSGAAAPPDQHRRASGFPQVSIPVARVEGEGPVGLSLLGAAGVGRGAAEAGGARRKRPLRMERMCHNNFNSHFVPRWPPAWPPAAP